MKPERIRPSTSIERVIQLATNRGHGKGIVVVANALVKLLASMLLGSEEVKELKRRRLNGREGDLSLIAAHPKPGIEKGGAGPALIQPMKSPTMRAANIERSKVMNLPSRIKGLACQRKNEGRQGLLNQSNQDPASCVQNRNLDSLDEGVEVQHMQQPTHQDPKHPEEE
jgi:hypothetical protein